MKSLSKISLHYKDDNGIQKMRDYAVGDIIRISGDLHTCMISKIFEASGSSCYKVISISHRYSSKGGFEFVSTEIDRIFQSQQLIERWPGISCLNYQDYKDLEFFVEGVRKKLFKEVPKRIDGDIIEFIRDVVNEKEEYYKPTLETDLKEVVMDRLKDEHQYIFDYIDSQLKEE